MTRLPPPPLVRPDDALYLDLDGTLAEFEDTPQGVRPRSERTRLISGLATRLGAAVAIVSGRTIEDIDRILGRSCVCVAGVHGLTRRQASGARLDTPPSAGLLEARQVLDALAQSEAGLLLEDKHHSLAMHFRRAPAAAEAVIDVCDRLAQRHGLAVQHGDRVCELRTAGPDKGDAIRAFQAEPPFAGRRPIMVGDDLTDEHGFVAATAFGGFGVLAGPPRRTAARYRLGSVTEVLDWLDLSLREMES